MTRTITRRLEFSPEFKNIDMFGIVHNCVYFEWFERGRMQIVSEILPPEEICATSLALVVRENFCKYLAPVRFGDSLALTTRHKISDKYTGKMEFLHELTDINTHRICAEGKSVCALFDISANTLRKEPDAKLWARYIGLK